MNGLIKIRAEIADGIYNLRNAFKSFEEAERMMREDGWTKENRCVIEIREVRNLLDKTLDQAIVIRGEDEDGEYFKD